MRARTDPAGGLHPFAYEFDLSAEARSGTEMALRLCADALKPPVQKVPTFLGNEAGSGDRPTLSWPS